MTPIYVTIFLLGLSSLAIAFEFTDVYQWNALQFESDRKEDFGFWIFPRGYTNVQIYYMAAYGTRIFLSLTNSFKDLPVTLASLPTTNASSTSPKLTPFPSWDMHEKGDCDKIVDASGLEVDTDGRLWVLDKGSNNCGPKIWIFDLDNDDETVFVHQFPENYLIQDLVLDETPNGTFAYISPSIGQHIVVFSLERKESWIVDTAGINVSSIALSPKREPRQLFLGKLNSNELYSISVDALRNGTRTANPKLAVEWVSSGSYRMLMDNDGNLMSVFSWRRRITYWDTYNQVFAEKIFLQLDDMSYKWPFTFALDQNGTFWATVRSGLYLKPTFRLLKTGVETKSYLFEPLPVPTHPPTTTTERTRTSLSISTKTTTKSATPTDISAITDLQVICIPTERLKQYQWGIIILIRSIVLSVILLSSIIGWLVWRLKRNNSLTQNSYEALEMSVFREELAEVQNEDLRSAAAHSVPDENDDIDTAEGLYEEAKDDQAAVTPPFLIL